MSSRFPSHQLNNGLYVSGRPEPPKEKAPTMSSTAVPYTGGDIKKSGELGKMFDVDHNSSRPRKSGHLANAPLRTGSLGGGNTSHSGQTSSHSVNRMSSLSGGVPGSASMKKTSSGPLNKHGEPIRKSSGPQGGGMISASRQNSGPLPPVLPATGLLTSGPILSGPLNSSGAPRKSSGPLDSSGSIKSRSTSMVKNQAVTHLSQEDRNSFFRSFPKLVFWSILLLFVMGFIAAVFILAAVGNPVLLIVVVVLFAAVSLAFTWNACRGRKAVIKFISERSADQENLDFLKVVTCGNVPLESSFQRVPRCVYTSTSLYEYRGWDSKAANPTHRRFTWGLRSMERHVVDFYISDFQSGLRALVKTGYGARVTPYVDESAVIDIDQSNKDMSPQFIRWYIKEGSSVSVMGVVQRNDNVLMIIPPPEPVPTGCQWATCMLPASLDGIVLRCEDSSNLDVIPV
ncbi:hypothetical protein Ccrd_002934 [Cynara cardunculus var. scolymus]|uniref:Ubiquitin-specific protease family C19-related protein n=1 Tax=Cynara cardunculus var. scolymus TaxID=59895 RepID=A0A118JW30_CYNCS|nr:hypothetical protein Ccrd_002934 [Cynara cardunculus var. scolymus]